MSIQHWNEGRKAYQDGIVYTFNPYPNGTGMAAMWRKGWESAFFVTILSNRSREMASTANSAISIAFAGQLWEPQ